MKNFYTYYVLLVLCTRAAFAQFIGQAQFPVLEQRNQLSPQQQGQILSDIQQHHRFNVQNQRYVPQQFKNQFNQPFPPTQVPFSQPQPTPQALVSTSQPDPDSRLIQHHTQTAFVPNQYQQGQFIPQQNPFQPRPTIDPIVAIEQQIRQLDPEKHKQKIKELREKQQIIEKHSQFVERQYEKALKKAQVEHRQFIEEQKEQKKKLYQKVYKPPGAETIRYRQNVQRYIYPEESPLFKLAIEDYYKKHPTTSTTTTTTTTSTTTKAPTVTPKKPKVSFLPTAAPTSQVKAIQTLDDLSLLQSQYRSQQIDRDDLLTQLRLAIMNGQEGDISKNLSSREISLANGKKVQLIETDDSKFLGMGKPEEITLPNGEKVQLIKAGGLSEKPDEITLPSGQKIQVVSTRDPKLLTGSSSSNVKTQEITLPNGQKVEVIKTTDPKLVPGATPLEPGSDLEKLVLAQTTTARPPAAVFEELTKGVLPPGANFDLLKTGASGGLEKVEGLSSQKKVTFVLLEEQEDGTLKVQGVKGSDKNKPEIDVDSILKRIKNGEIKLPPHLKNPTPSPALVTEATTASSADLDMGVTILPNSVASNDPPSIPVLKTNIGTHFVATSTPSSTVYTKIFQSTTVRPTVSSTVSSTTPHRVSTRQPYVSHQNDLLRQASSSQRSSQNAIYAYSPTLKQPKPTVPTLPLVTIQQSVSPPLPTTALFAQSTQAPSAKSLYEELPDVLKKNGLYAMAKFLKQSGLDTILNETGPYTIFVPTDKAFRTLLVQLGGPEKAEEKFKENPRLLSGLLLHHVIPGAFTISSLQDEMTGVSLAGTQLRVNQYTMHDVEWNDIKITTINGAKVLDEKKDVEIPQGVAHSIDRVMFPLPVGDIVQTLQSDREKRFTSFLRALFSSGLAETLQGTKTFTLFAPTDKAFGNLSSEELSKTISDRASARDLILRHLTAGTLYTNGMRYFQIRESLVPERQMTISKQSGKIKINNVQLATQNIPSTNGVIHAIDTLL